MAISLRSSIAKRSSHLNAALVSLRKEHQKFTPKVLKIQLLAFKLHNWTIKFG
ncbi:acetyltransferase, partial [Vibrio cholerae]|nr:acetyltransferase [Vibrio cholerae]